MTYWEFKGRELVNCTCEYGCNCQFNALPDKGHCHAVAAVHDRRGQARRYPPRRAQLRRRCSNGPARSTRATAKSLPIVDERADAQQREALLKIMSGQDTDPFATVFAVFATTMEKVHEPVFAPIEFEVDVDGRRGQLSIPGYVEMTGEPIRNPVERAEFARPDPVARTASNMRSPRSAARPAAPPADRWRSRSTSKYAQFANLHLSTHGVVRAAA